MSFFLVGGSDVQFTEIELSGFTAKALRMMAQYEPGVTAGTPEIIKFLNGRDLSDSDRTFIENYAEKVESGKIYDGDNLEESIYSRGGTVRHGKTMKRVQFGDGTQSDFVSGPVVVPAKEVTRDHVQEITVLVSAFFDIQGAVVTQIGSFAVWKDRFRSMDVPIDVNSLHIARGVLQDLLVTSCPQWETIKKEGQTVEGKKFQLLLFRTLTTCPWFNFFKFHTSLCTSVIRYAKVQMKEGKPSYVRIFYEDEKGGSKYQVAKERVAALSAEGMEGEARKAVVDFTAKFKLPPLLFKGPLDAKHNFPSAKEKTSEESHKSMTMATTFRGGEKRGIGSMIGAYGYAQSQSSNMRSRCSLISMAVGLMKSKKKIEVFCTVSDVVMVKNSLKHHCPEGDYTIYCEPTEYAKVGEKDRERVVYTPTQDRILVKVWKLGVPSVPVIAE